MGVTYRSRIVRRFAFRERTLGDVAHLSVAHAAAEDLSVPDQRAGERRAVARLEIQ